MEIGKVETEFDEQLRLELNTINPSEDRIRELVRQGADISGSFLIDALFCYVLKPHEGKSLDAKYFKLFIELGADVNYEDDGFNSLFEASFCWNVELVELLIKAHANVNCISTDSRQSLLDCVSFMQRREQLNGCDGYEPLARIIDILKANGAKYYNELHLSTEAK